MKQPAIAIAKLIRLPNGFSIISNFLAAYIVFGGIVGEANTWLQTVALILPASLCFYFAGMVGNDLADFKEDSKHRPERVLPSGALSKRVAQNLFVMLTIIGLILAGVAARFLDSPTTIVLAVALLSLILFYNWFAKHHWFGSLIMAACRVVNVYMIVAHLFAAENFSENILATPHLYPIAIGLYICGVTLFAENEEGKSNRTYLAFAALVISLGLIGFCLVGLFGSSAGIAANMPRLPIIFVCLIFPVIRNLLVAVSSPHPQLVQRAVGASLRSVILIDAFVCYAIRPDQPWIAILLVVLLVIGFFLGKWIRST